MAQSDLVVLPTLGVAHERCQNLQQKAFSVSNGFLSRNT